MTNYTEVFPNLDYSLVSVDTTLNQMIQKTVKKCSAFKNSSKWETVRSGEDDQIIKWKK